jgi:hypothetical protein
MSMNAEQSGRGAWLVDGEGVGAPLSGVGTRGDRRGILAGERTRLRLPPPTPGIRPEDFGLGPPADDSYVPLAEAARMVRYTPDELAAAAARRVIEARWAGAMLYARPAIVAVTRIT